jgi:phenylacetate-coenzyme A ligase PaaK-like adenylate-forming protein
MLGGGRIELYGLENYELTVFPVGSYDARRKLDLMRIYKPHAIMATTSYLGHLSAVGNRTGKLPMPKVLFGGGEGASYSWFEQQQELWRAPIFNHYGSTQTRVDHMYPCERGIGTTTHPGLLHNIEPGFYV